MTGSNRIFDKNNIIEQTVESLSCNSDDNYHPSSIINLCRYVAENYEDEFITTAGGSDLKLSGQISEVETASMMSDVGHSISHLRILFRILRTKVQKCLSLKNDEKISRDMINPKFGEYNYYY